MKMLKSNGPSNCRLYCNRSYINKYCNESFINNPAFLNFVPESGKCVVQAQHDFLGLLA